MNEHTAAEIFLDAGEFGEFYPKVTDYAFSRRSQGEGVAVP
jgi:hypothetical protein